MDTMRILFAVVLLMCGAAMRSSSAATPVKISGPTVTFGDVLTNFRISPDNHQALYLADQDADSVLELYRVSVTGGTPEKVNPPLVAGGDVDGAEFSPDGAWIVYRADQDIDESRELYSVPSSGGTAVKLNDPLPAGRSVGGQILANSSRVAYTADYQAVQMFEVFSVPIDGGSPTKLNSPLVAGGDVFLFDAKSSADRVFYYGDQDIDGVTELYSAPASGGAPVKLNGSLGSGGYVNTKGVAVSRDGGRAVYLANQNISDVFELFSVPSGGGAAVPISGSLVGGGDVRQSSIHISPNSDRVIFLADADTDEVMELYSVPIDGGARTKLNAPLVIGGSVLENSLQFSNDGGRVLYMADQEVLLANCVAGEKTALKPTWNSGTISPPQKSQQKMASEIFDPPLDTGIAGHVLALRAAGIETFESCEGGPGHAYPEPTVRFYGDQSDGFRALSAAIKSGLKVSALRRSWPVIDNEPTGPWWELTFVPTTANS